MVANLKKIDMYGVPFSLNTFGKSKFTTYFGGFLTIVTLVVVGLCTYLFGTDFWYKENPNVIPDELVHLTSKKVNLATDKLTFMVSLQDGSAKPYDIDAIPFKTFGYYFQMRKDSDGVHQLVCNTSSDDNILTKCSKTKATLNFDLKKEKLENWLCFDMEKIKDICKEKHKYLDYQPILGGFIDEDEYGVLALRVSNYFYDPILKKKSISEPFSFVWLLLIVY